MDALSLTTAPLCGACDYLNNCLHLDMILLLGNQVRQDGKWDRVFYCGGGREWRGTPASVYCPVLSGRVMTESVPSRDHQQMLGQGSMEDLGEKQTGGPSRFN